MINISIRKVVAFAILFFILAVPKVWSDDDLGLYCFPNPVISGGNGLTIAFDSTSGAVVTLEIFTIDGYNVRVLLDGVTVQVEELTWDLTNGAGEELIPGAYVAVLRVAGLPGGEKMDRFVFIVE
ncbi:MAG: hypothetical protein KAJ19_16210 [Gammaproteobacteria bacterium]|nr:hypothetical protein [Gammaproteobacteria bacterium]